jgi:hypothetical protein
MTNEQLAILIKQIARRIRATAESIEPLITDGERIFEYKWVGSGIPPLLPIGEGWEFQQTGPFAAVLAVVDLAEELEKEAKTLLK